MIEDQVAGFNAKMTKPELPQAESILQAARIPPEWPIMATPSREGTTIPTTLRDLDASEATAQRFHGQQLAQGRAELTAAGEKWRRDAKEATHGAPDNPLRLSQSASMRRGRRLLPGLLKTSRSTCAGER